MPACARRADVRADAGAKLGRVALAARRRAMGGEAGADLGEVDEVLPWPEIGRARSFGKCQVGVRTGEGGQHSI